MYSISSILKVRQEVNNPVFNYGEFAIIRQKAGANGFKISVKEWAQKTNAIGITAVRGRSPCGSVN